jgi:N-acetylneuraminate synthase
MGATVLEKHIVDDCLRKGTDSESALGPEEFSQFVRMVKRASEAFNGETLLSFSEAEDAYRKSMKKRVVARTEIPAKRKITSDVLIFLRADEGYPISRVGEVLGRTSKRAIEAQKPITEGMLY